jgi:Fur family ferric uptake transcriptional regulator
MNKDIVSSEDLLRAYGLRATTGRSTLLTMLSKEEKPLSVTAIKKKVGSSLDTVTVYRALESLESVGIVERVDLGHDHTHYEMVSGRRHHHHAVCRDCGLVEDIEVPHAKNPRREALAATKQFSTINRYSLSFFGLCKKCA